MSRINFKCISNIKEAEIAWKQLSPSKSIYDDWDFRYCYYKFFQYPLFFYAGFDNNELIGLLPLMWNEEKGYLDFFAGFSYMEDNAIFIKKDYEKYYNNFLECIDRPALLEYLRPDMKLLQNSVIQDFNYSVNLRSLRSYEDFIYLYLGKNTAKKLFSQFKKIQKRGIKIIYDRFDDLDLLVYWNKAKFGANSSFYQRPHWEKFIKTIAKKYPSKIISVEINKKIEGVGLVIFYNNICYGINSGYNPTINNLGKYITMLKIDAGIKARATTYDAGSGSFGWKEDFHLIKKPQYQLDLRPKHIT